MFRLLTVLLVGCGNSPDNSGTVALEDVGSEPVAVSMEWPDDPAGRDIHAWVSWTEDGSLVAVAGRDPGSGCAINWEANRETDVGTGAFKALCSGSVFSATGDVLFGPSPRSLDQVAFEVTNDEVHVDGEALTLGMCTRLAADTPCSDEGAPKNASEFPQAPNPPTP